MIIDTHVHIGQFREGYHDAKEVYNAFTKAGVDEICVSSTTTCDENYPLVVSEMKELKKLGGSRVHPLFWISPKMLESGKVEEVINSGVEWEGMKMHYHFSHEWYELPSLAVKAVKYAQERHWPVLEHTGEDIQCHPLVFDALFKDFPDVTFIMAHGRPLNETITMLKRYPNTLTDTAFMPADDVVELKNQGFIDRILFGSDYPINCHFPQVTQGYPFISECINNLKARLTPNEFDKIMYINALKVYKR